jgi:hypothetical protein
MIDEQLVKLASGDSDLIIPISRFAVFLILRIGNPASTETWKDRNNLATIIIIIDIDMAGRECNLIRSTITVSIFNPVLDYGISELW